MGGPDASQVGRGWALLAVAARQAGAFEVQEGVPSWVLACFKL